MPKGLKYYLVRDKHWGPYSTKEIQQYVDEKRISLGEVCQEANVGGATHRIGDVLEDQKKFEEHAGGDADDVTWELQPHDVVGEDEERQFEENRVSPDSWDKPGVDPLVETFSGVTVPTLSNAENIKAARDAEIAAALKAAHQGEIIYEGHGSMLAYLPVFGWSSFWLIIGFSLWQLSMLFAVAALLVVSYSMFTAARHHEMHCYQVDKRRIHLITGVFTKSTKEIPIRDIRDIRVTRRGFLGGLFDIGDVTFNPAAGPNSICFHYIKNPGKVQDLVRKIQDEAAAHASNVSKIPDHKLDYFGLKK